MEDRSSAVVSLMDFYVILSLRHSETRLRNLGCDAECSAREFLRRKEKQEESAHIKNSLIIVTGLAHDRERSLHVQ